jgi:hypothetical protein
MRARDRLRRLLRGARLLFEDPKVARELVELAAAKLDDHGWFGYRPQKRALDEFAASRGAMILTLPTGQGLLLKS